jgi:hypothetical protein
MAAIGRSRGQATRQAGFGSRKRSEIFRLEKVGLMNLAFWAPAMFFLGILAMLLCFLFLKGCEKI